MKLQVLNEKGIVVDQQILTKKGLRPKLTDNAFAAIPLITQDIRY